MIQRIYFEHKGYTASLVVMPAPNKSYFPLWGVIHFQSPFKADTDIATLVKGDSVKDLMAKARNAFRHVVRK